MKNTSELQAVVQRLNEFLEGLESYQLNGNITLNEKEFLKSSQSLTYGEARQILLQLSLNQKRFLKKNWTTTEVSFLFYLIDKAALKLKVNVQMFHEKIWNQIGFLIPGHPGNACRIKYFSLLSLKVSQNPWTGQEDENLKNLLSENEFDWKKISLQLFQRNRSMIYRSPKQCKERYSCYLKPNIKKGFWTDEEDYQLCCSFLNYNGKIWSKITGDVFRRSENAVKNRFYLLFQSRTYKSKLYHSELVRLVKKKKEILEKKLGFTHKNIEKSLSLQKINDQKEKEQIQNSDFANTFNIADFLSL